MSKSRKSKTTEVDVISWAIPRIAGGHYAISDDERGRELWVTEFEPTLAEMEGELCHGPDKRAEEPLRRLKEDCNLANVKTFFAAILGEKLGEMMTEQFSSIALNTAHYPVVVAVGYKQLHLLISGVQHIVARGREGLSVDSLARLERDANPEAVSVGVVAHYANEMSHLFPKMIRRAERLRIVPILDTAPSDVQHYIEEASKCYIYGRFVACLIVCRSAVEFALRERLLSKGQEQALSILKNQKNDSLWGLIQLARSVFSKELKPTLDDSDAIRRAARDAVHVAEPHQELCKEMFIKTRGVLGELYSVSD
jgi:hypothetical protein